jgi:hypothetical protein
VRESFLIFGCFTAADDANATGAEKEEEKVFIMR